MPSNKIAVLIIIISLLPLGMSLYAVFLSGSEVAMFPLQGKRGQTQNVNLRPEMNPLRLLMTMHYGSDNFDTAENYIEYTVKAESKAGKTLWVDENQVSGEVNKTTATDQSHYSLLQTFDIKTATNVHFSYQIKEASFNLRYKGGYLTLRRNVTPHNMIITIAGIVLLVSGILIIAIRKSKKSD